MRYPAKVMWFDREPEAWQDFTVLHVVASGEELETVLDRFEQDARSAKFPLIGNIHDCEGHELTFGFHHSKDQAFLSFQPKHLLTNEKGHYQFQPVQWSIADPAEASALPPIGRLKGPERIPFFPWSGYDPIEIMPPYCVPMISARQAVREYLDEGRFSKCIGWGERKDWTIKTE